MYSDLEDLVLLEMLTLMLWGWVGHNSTKVLHLARFLFI